MPALQLFGRRWHIASDDLPVFTAPGAAFHAAWAGESLIHVDMLLP